MKKRIKNICRIWKYEGLEGLILHCQLFYAKKKSWKDPYIYRYDIKQIEKRQSILEYEKIAFKKYKTPTVSIIIPVYNHFEYTYQCLKSIEKHSGNIMYEIIVADDSSSDLTRNMDQVVDGITIIKNRSNYKFLLNCNEAAKIAKGKYILFLNNDTQVQDNWLAALVKVFENDNKAGLTGSKLIYPDGSLQEAGGIVWNDATVLEYGNGCNPQSPQFNYLKEADYISGASILVRKELWEETGGFDIRYAPAYYEDVDLAFTIRSLGYKIIYQPQSEVVHLEGASEDTGNFQKKEIDRNRKLFLEKWGRTLKSRHYKKMCYGIMTKKQKKGY